MGANASARFCHSSASSTEEVEHTVCKRDNESCLCSVSKFQDELELHEVHLEGSSKVQRVPLESHVSVQDPPACPACPVIPVATSEAAPVGSPPEISTSAPRSTEKPEIDTSKHAQVAETLPVELSEQVPKTINVEIEREKAERIAEQKIQDATTATIQRCEEGFRMELRESRHRDFQEMISRTRRLMKETHFQQNRPANRYGWEGEWPAFDVAKHVPLLALINPMSGAMAGADILGVARRLPYYEDRFFNIIDVVKSEHVRGGMLDVFRIELNNAKEEAKKLCSRPRIISGGGDGTGSFALYIIFLALKADETRADDGLGDSGNGFIWTDEELASYFPAIAQMPLGSANDFGHILGWGDHYPGDKVVFGGHAARFECLRGWIQAIIDPSSRVVNFDIWGIMPQGESEQVDFKIAELHANRGLCPKEGNDIYLKEAGKPVPFFVCLYFSAGFSAYMVARFQINRRKTPFSNKMEYVRQGAGIIAERTPNQMEVRLDAVEVDCHDEAYFPPRRDKGNRGRKYREVGFYNINWQAKNLHGYSREKLSTRLNPCNSRKPACFNDGYIDMFRWKFMSLLKNPGVNIQTDRKKDMALRFKGGKGKGFFFQWDGEARFAFSPTGEEFTIFVQKVLNIPVVLGPFLDERITGPLDNGKPVQFRFEGETKEDRDRVRKRVLRNVSGELNEELNATSQEIIDASLPCRSTSAPP
eukprot:TRINITY_DN8186_c0_g1_i3.p1 TRINITY_DN8186_c0_g1~~TRINITY_DN8186_c0_g1_i3.p1  ORF type:complete len:705 (-),score=133.32 TRINITY_DN8186_c0_g1_i3:60-2174(-)